MISHICMFLLTLSCHTCLCSLHNCGVLAWSLLATYWAYCVILIMVFALFSQTWFWNPPKKRDLQRLPNVSLSGIMRKIYSKYYLFTSVWNKAVEIRNNVFIGCCFAAKWWWWWMIDDAIFHWIYEFIEDFSASLSCCVPCNGRATAPHQVSIGISSNTAANIKSDLKMAVLCRHIQVTKTTNTPSGGISAAF